MRRTIVSAVLMTVTLILAACVPRQSINQAALKLESEWQATNAAFLEKEGRRAFSVNKQQAFGAALRTAGRLGMIVEKESFETGFVLMTAPAPVPLTMSDWQAVQAADTRQMREIIDEDLGLYRWWVTLDPSGKEVLGNVIVSETTQGVAISLSLGLKLKDATTDRLRRMQPPPTAVRLGVEKFWAAFEAELAAAGPAAAKSAASPGAMAAPGAVASVATQRNPDAVALIIGNKHYGEKIPPVAYADNDAAAMKRFAVDILGLSENNIMTLDDATLDDMEAALGNTRSHMGKLWRWVRPGDSDLFIFYSGHGVPGSKDKRAYLLPVDANPDMAEVQGYPLELLYRNLARMEARSVTVFIDACFSGESPGGPLVREASGIRVAPKTVPVASMTVITAARDDQLASWDKGSQHGLFTKYLVDALGGGADQDRFGRVDSRVTLGEVKAYLDREMTYAARREFGRTQEAMVFGDPERVLVTIGAK